MKCLVKVYHTKIHYLLILIFSENLSIPVKFEPQSLHLSYSYITVHSGILKNHGEKSYPSYLSDDWKHDQSFIKIVIEEMLKDADIEPGNHTVIESDNSSSQYKSATPFHNIQELSDKYKLKIIHIYSIAGHESVTQIMLVFCKGGSTKRNRCWSFLCRCRRYGCVLTINV